MACETGETSAILDCICYEGQSIADWITSLQQQITNLINLTNGFQTQIDAINNTLTNQATTLATHTTQITQLLACCAQVQADIVAMQGQLHPALTLTKVQDVANRASLNVANQVLNLPPAIAARVGSTTLSQSINSIALEVVLGMTPDLDTVGGMAVGSRIIVPRTGRYDVRGTWSAMGDASCTDYVVGAQILVNGSLVASATAAPDVAGTNDQVIVVHTLLQLTVGAVLELGAFTDCTDGSVIIEIASLSAEYVEGT